MLPDRVVSPARESFFFPYAHKQVPNSIEQQHQPYLDWTSIPHTLITGKVIVRDA